MRRMSMGYGATFSIGIVALPFAGIALGGLYLQRQGRDPTDAFNGSGLVCFVLMFGLAFLLRLILWERSPPAVRDATRSFLGIVQCLLAAASLLTVVLALSEPGLPGSLKAFSVLALFCSGVGLLWVFRFRREL